MRILVTRAEPDASVQAATLQKLGHHALIAPMLEVETCAPQRFDHSMADAIIATSRNGLRAIERHPDLPALSALPLFVVGPKTAEVADQLGFQNVITGPAAGAELVETILDSALIRENHRRLIYLAPEQTAFGLADNLRQGGLTVDQQVVYRTKAASSLPKTVFQAISVGEIDCVVLMSARTAAIYADLMISNGLQKQAGTIMCLCFSEAVAAALQDLNPRVVEIAIHPRTEEMLALVRRMEEKSK